MIINLVIAFCLRLVFSFLPGLSLDMRAWFGWAERLVSSPWANFYSKTVWTNYTPGYFYVLFLLRQIELLFKGLFSINLFGIWKEVLYKIPANLADIGIGLLIYQILKNKSRKAAILASAFYLFNFAIIFNSSVWGQVDSVMTLLLLLAVYFLFNKKIIFSSFSYALAFLVKPQSLFLAPLFLLLLIKQKDKMRYLKFILVFIVMIMGLSWPFFQNDPFFGIWKMVGQMGKDYSYTSLNAFNFWYLFGNWQSDKVFFLGISKYLWGLVMFSLFEILIILKVFLTKKLLKDKSWVFLVASLLILNFFLFPTRVHERYLFPFFAFFTIAVFSQPYLKMVLIYVFLSVIHFLNLYYVYCIYQNNFLKINLSYELISNLSPFLSLSTIIIFGYLLYVFWREEDFSKNSLKLIVRRLFKKIKLLFFEKKFLILILIFSFLVRFWNLGYPPKFYFDEVYHAFTATEMAKGNIAAWEWWNKPPPGVAYEWTHPYLAKYFMVLGIKILGELAFAWRFFGALLGVACVLLVYLLGKKLFSQRVAILASFLFAFDGLPLVMSRIGMNDSYFLFFALLTLLLFLEEKYILAGLVFGLSLSSKWTAIYLLPILVLWKLAGYLKIKKNQQFNYLKRTILIFVACFLLLPGAIYFLSYFSFFQTGHSLNQWWELQHQMWWYHTRLSATHTYQSPALSWPFLVRPVWFFVDYPSTSLRTSLIANIYAMGNPFIWWGGLISLPFVIWRFLTKKNWQLGLVIFAYFSFFLPWVFSPRIMFIYHYLPSIPFLCLFLGWVMDQFWENKKGSLLITSYLLLVMISFFFFYPHWIGLHVPKWFDNLYYWFPSWK